MRLRLVCVILWAVCGYFPNSAAQDIHIVYIGNSITHGASLKQPETEAPPVQASNYVAKELKATVDYRNCGVSGATTLDFLPVSEKHFLKVKAAGDEFAARKGTLVFSIMLGTNDSACEGPFGAPVEPVAYYTNLKAIVDELITLYPDCKVVIQRPVWYSPNTYNGAVYLAAGLKRLESYMPMIEKLVTRYSQTLPGRVYQGDTEAFDRFKDQLAYFTPENGNAGTFYLHPNKAGAELLGQYWAKAISKVLFPKAK